MFRTTFKGHCSASLVLALGLLAWLVNLYDISLATDATRHMGGLMVFFALRVGAPWQAFLVALGAAAGGLQNHEPLYGPLLEVMEVVLIGIYLRFRGAASLRTLDALRFRGAASLRTLDALFWVLMLAPTASAGAQAGDLLQSVSIVAVGLLCSQANIALSALLVAALPLILVRRRVIRPATVSTQEYIASWITVLLVLPLFAGMALIKSENETDIEAHLAIERRAYSALGAAHLEAMQIRYRARLAALPVAGDSGEAPSAAQRVPASGFTRIISVAAHQAPPPTADVWVAALQAGEAPRVLLGEVPLARIRAQLASKDATRLWHVIRRNPGGPCVSLFDTATCSAGADADIGVGVVPNWSQVLHVWATADAPAVQTLHGSRHERAELVMVLLWLLASLPGYAASRRVTVPLTRSFDALAKVSGGQPLPISNPNLLMLAPRIIARQVARLSFLMKRKQAELDLVLKEQETILSTAPIVLFLFDLTRDNDFVVLRFSQSLQTMLGWTVAEAMRGRQWFVENVHPDDRFDDRRLFSTFRSTGKATAQHRFRCKDGSYRYLQGELSLLEWRAGDVCRVVGVWVDITDYTRAIKRADTNERLLSLATLASGLAHELKQPLNVIAMAVGNARRALVRATPDANIYAIDKLERIAAQVERASAIIDEMRPRQPGFGNLALPVGHDACQMLRRVVSYFLDELLALDIRIEFVPTTWPVLVKIDGNRLEQVVVNLIANARDAIMDARHHRLAAQDDLIEVCIDKTATGAVRIVVSDTGTGIDEQHASRLFEPFFSTKGEGDGRGLGLFTAANLLRDMNGTISAGNTGSGARFTIELLPFASDALNSAKV